MHEVLAARWFAELHQLSRGRPDRGARLRPGGDRGGGGAAQVWVYLPAWRWCLFAAWAAPVGYTTRVAMHGVVLLIESRSLARHAALYYVVAIRVGTPPDIGNRRVIKVIINSPF